MFAMEYDWPVPGGLILAVFGFLAVAVLVAVLLIVLRVYRGNERDAHDG